jgi:hypothetical protein
MLTEPTIRIKKLALQQLGNIYCLTKEYKKGFIKSLDYSKKNDSLQIVLQIKYNLGLL